MLFVDCKLGNTYTILYERHCDSIRKTYRNAKLCFILYNGVGYSDRFLIKIFGTEHFKVKVKTFVFKLEDKHYIAIPAHSKACKII